MERTNVPRNERLQHIGTDRDEGGPKEMSASPARTSAGTNLTLRRIREYNLIHLDGLISYQNKMAAGGRDPGWSRPRTSLYFQARKSPHTGSKARR